MNRQAGRVGLQCNKASHTMHQYYHKMEKGSDLSHEGGDTMVINDIWPPKICLCNVSRQNTKKVQPCSCSLISPRRANLLFCSRTPIGAGDLPVTAQGSVASPPADYKIARLSFCFQNNERSLNANKRSKWNSNFPELVGVR